MEDDGMGMMTGLGISNSNTRRIQIKDINGTVVGTISITKSKTTSNTKKMKRLQYNFKQISSQIMMSKTSNIANRVVTKARSKVVELLRKKTVGDYDDRELESAIIHAKKMERIARKRVKHLKEEENAGKQDPIADKLEEENESCIENSENEKNPELNKEELEKLMQELKKLMNETELDDLEEEILSVAKEDLNSNDLERLKKKHRADELREIMEADLKYLRALFDKLEKEKQETSSGSGNLNNLSGIYLELDGFEMPVEAAPQPVMTEGGNIDFSV